uniref:Protein SPEC3 n=1 Tax=Elaeophora elaphi TaxID=1147741 RepID=A0A0R3RR94_9BILA
MKQQTESASKRGSSTLSLSESHKRMDNERLRGWKRVQKALPRIIHYGQNEGILHPSISSQMGSTYNSTYNTTNVVMQSQVAVDVSDHRLTDKVQIPSNDITIMHEAIPFLPVPVALLCLFLNVFIPGSGTILSGISALCIGQPRVNFKEGRKLVTLFVNFLVGISQFFTITFLFVGWFWSIAWGGLIIIHSMQYRDALVQRRQEAVATAAIEAITKDSILHRRDVKKLVVAHQTIAGEKRT